jgi:hypothetical protein
VENLTSMSAPESIHLSFGLMNDGNTFAHDIWIRWVTLGRGEKDPRVRIYNHVPSLGPKRRIVGSITLETNSFQGKDPQIAVITAWTNVFGFKSASMRCAPDVKDNTVRGCNLNDFKPYLEKLQALDSPPPFLEKSEEEK